MAQWLPVLLFAAVLPAQIQKLDLKVLYAGVVDHPRTEQWRTFLAAHTTSVAVVDVKAIADGDGKDVDVVILDCPGPDRAQGRWSGREHRRAGAEGSHCFVRSPDGRRRRHDDAHRSSAAEVQLALNVSL